eukprot:gene31014-38332_t
MFLLQLTLKDGSQHTFNALSEQSREQTIAVFNFSARDYKWTNPFPVSDIIAEEEEWKQQTKKSKSSEIITTFESDKRLEIQEKINKYSLLASQTSDLTEQTLSLKECKPAGLSLVNPDDIRPVTPTPQVKDPSKSSVKSPTPSLQRHTPMDETFEGSTQQAVERKKQALIKVQRLWRSKSVRERVLSSILTHKTASGFTQEQVEALALKLQCKHRVFLARKALHAMQERFCPQIVLLKVDAVQFVNPRDKPVFAQVTGVVEHHTSAVSSDSGGASVSTHNTSSDSHHVGSDDMQTSLFSVLPVTSIDQGTQTVSHVAMIAHTSHLDHICLRLTSESTSFLHGHHQNQLGEARVDMTEMVHAATFGGVQNQSIKFTLPLLHHKVQENLQSQKQFEHNTHSSSRGSRTPCLVDTPTPVETPRVASSSASTDREEVSFGSASGVSIGAQLLRAASRDSFEGSERESLESCVPDATRTSGASEPRSPQEAVHSPTESTAGSASSMPPLPPHTKKPYSFSKTVKNVMAVQTLYRKHKERHSHDHHLDKHGDAAREGEDGSTLGTVSLTACVVDMTFAMCGWMTLQWDGSGGGSGKEHHSHSGASVFMSSKHKHNNAPKRRWFMLVDNHLMYFHSNLTLDAVKYSISCADVTAIVEGRGADGKKNLRVTFNERIEATGGDKTHKDSSEIRVESGLRSKKSSFFTSSKNKSTSSSSVVDPTLTEASLLHTVGRAGLDKKTG